MNYSIEKLSKHDNLLGLIGYPLSHSFSKGYFAKKFKEEDIPGWFYESFPLTEARHFKQLFERLPNLRGINVTLPYKEQVIPFLDELEKGAAEIGAVNTIKRVGDRLLGFNTDVYGFQQSLVEKMNESGLTFKGALILGTGGAAKAVQYVLQQLNMEILTVSRTEGKADLTYKGINQDILSKYKLIVNTTPLGMAPKVDACPDIPYEYLDKNHMLYDLVYNPEKTLFLANGEAQGSAIINGLQMLHLQAEKAWQIWTST